MTKPILILDDDVSFRQLIASLLQARGYEVFEARSAKDASAAFAETDPGLAIVDYRLPESDGISWITWLRESGRNFPVVFCSGTWCDEKTFNWLRNILKVSLILRKPIVPELFIQQIEGLLPPPPFSVSPAIPQTGAVAKAQFVAPPPVTANDLETQIKRIDEALRKSSPDSPLWDQLVAMRAKLAVQQSLAEAKNSYANELTEHWKSLSEAVALTQLEPENRVALNEAMQIAHRIRGTAGSMGFQNIGHAAGKIEDLLRSFDPTDTLQEVIWTEIFRGLADGEVAVREQSGLAGSTERGQIFESSILVFARSASYTEQLQALASSRIETTMCDSIASVLGRAKRARFDAAVFDLSLDDEARVFKLASQVREVQRGKPIPLSFISSGQNAPDEALMAYAGASSFLWSPVPGAELVETVQKLIVIGGTKKPKVLTVDDDDVLTRFIQTILAGEGMRVETLNKPIQILTVVEQFQPDLILLDVMMPGLSGYDVCRMLRATDKWAHLPVLFLTSKSDADGRASAFQAGASDFLSKPVLAPELVARVQAHLGQVGVKRDASKRGNDLGLIDRREFIETARSMAQAAKASGSELALCLMLIDDMLNLSILHGMYAAEKAEVALGELLRVHFKAEALRAKWGDGGFALTVPGESKMTITEAVQKMLDEFCTFTFLSDQHVNFKTSFSAGLAGVPGDEVTIESLMNMANIRMSRGRQQNLGTIVSVG